MQNSLIGSAAGIRRLLFLGCAAGIGISLVVAPAGADVPGAAEITQKYDEAGGASSPLGNPVGEAVEVAGGASRDYQGGAIFYSPPDGAHVMYGVILNEFRELGGPASDLGFPTNDESDTTGVAGRFNTFAAPDGAAMYWTPQQGAWVVRGPILAAYRELQGPAGELGFPTAAATVDGNGATVQKFSGDNGAAQITWSAENGFTTVPGSLAGALAGLRLPSMTGVLPEGSVQLPDGRVQLPDGSIKMPDGSYQLPNGNVVMPDGSIKLPDGSIQLPEGAVRLGDGSLQYANGLIRMPDGSFSLPDGAVQLPDGTVRMPDGSIVFPSGGVKMPDGSFDFPGMAFSSAEKSTGWWDRLRDNMGGWWWIVPVLIALLVLAALAGLYRWFRNRGGGANTGGPTGGPSRPGGGAGWDDRAAASGATRADATGRGVTPGGMVKGAAAAGAAGAAGVGGRAREMAGDATSGLAGAGRHAADRMGDMAGGVADTGRRVGETVGSSGKHAGAAAAGVAAAGAGALAGARRGAPGAVAGAEVNALFDELEGADVINTAYAGAAQGLSGGVVHARLLIDENMSPRLVEILDAAGYDAVHARDVGLGGGANRATLEKAKTMGRTLVTCERSYARDMIGNPATGSVVILDNAEGTIDDHLAVLRRALPMLDAVLAGGALAVASDQGVRARRLPLTHR
ncbi:DUF5615 family PIN-like protein [Nocardia sp. NPDC003693]